MELLPFVIIDLLLIVCIRMAISTDDSKRFEADLQRQRYRGKNPRWDSYWADHGRRVAPARLKVKARA